MASHLCFTIRFLQPYCHGRGGDGEPEWPPSPLRLFQALVAAAAARWNQRIRVEYAVPALRWLESQPAPMIVAVPGTRSDATYRLYVPDNVADKVASSWSRGREASIAEYRTEKDVRPTRLLGEAVHYLFPIADSDPEFEKHRNTLIDAARSITHLGWGIDMVVGNGHMLSDEESVKLPGERWRPAERSSPEGLRVPTKGSLDDLAAKHAAFLNRLSDTSFKPVPPLSTFRVVAYRRANDLPGRPYAAYKLLHPVLERLAWFSPTRANCVAAMMRHAAALAAAQESRSWVDSYIHGHRRPAEDASPRFSYLPLPTVEPRGKEGPAVGGIRRVLIAELVEATSSHISWARHALPGQFLVDEKSGDPKAMLVPLGDGDWVLGRYTGSSSTWASVTPVVLPGSDEGRLAKAEKLFTKALRHAGYPPDLLADFEFRNVSFWPGVDLALSFQRPDYLKRGHWSVYHMRLRWRRPIDGPLALGAGRHCGLGVFAALATSAPR